MAVTLDAGVNNRFPEVIAVDAYKRGDSIDLCFHTWIDDQGAALRIGLTAGQWENLKFLVDSAAGS